MIFFQLMEKVNYESKVSNFCFKWKSIHVYLRILARQTGRRNLAFTYERSRVISVNSKINIDLYGLEEEEAQQQQKSSSSSSSIYCCCRVSRLKRYMKLRNNSLFFSVILK